MTDITAAQIARFWSRVEVSANGCWNWTHTINRDGYASFSSAKGSTGHRFSYELHVGPIPEGLTIDHLCRNTACVNPAHLEPVTSAENTRRGAQATKTHCIRGHEFTPENTRRKSATPAGGRRECRTCQRERDRRRYLRSKGVDT